MPLIWLNPYKVVLPNPKDSQHDTGMEKSSANPNPVVRPPLSKNEGAQARKNDLYYRSVYGSLNFLTNSVRPNAQFVVH